MRGTDAHLIFNEVPMKPMLAFVTVGLLCAVVPAADWPGFRGTGDGIAAEKTLPTKWSEAENLAWVADLPGYGQSAPVVWNGTVYLTAVDGEQREKGFVVALDATTGKEKWRHAFEPTQKAKWSYLISRAAPTPCADADGVYAMFEGGNLIALSHAGKVRWERSLWADYGEFQNNHGFGSSPAQTADAVVVLVDHKGPSYLLAVEKKTGKTRWKTDRASRGSWTSPVVADRGGKPEVVASSNGSVAGYDAATGKQTWEVTGFSGNTLPSATVGGGFVVVGGGKGRDSGGGKEDPKDTVATAAIRLPADGKPGGEVAWKAPQVNASYATPLVADGRAYFVNQVGVVYCLDLKTGKELFAERIAGPCWASPVAAGGHVYFFGKDGRTTVLKAGPAFEEVAVNRLWDAAKFPRKADPKPEAGEGKQTKGPSGEYLDPIVYGVAAADGAFFVRTGTQLYRVGK